jgi:hypothetical protein
MGTWESSGIPKCLEFEGKGQNTSHWGVLYIIWKLSKCRCRKWAHLSHLDICNTTYGQKKGRESTWPQCVQVEWDTPLESARWELQLCFRPCPNPRFEQRVIVSQNCESPNFGNFGTKSHSIVGVTERHKEYYMGEGGGFPQVWAMLSLVSPESPVVCPNTKGAPESELINLLVGLMQVWVSN